MLNKLESANATLHPSVDHERGVGAHSVRGAVKGEQTADFVARSADSPTREKSAPSTGEKSAPSTGEPASPSSPRQRTATSRSVLSPVNSSADSVAKRIAQKLWTKVPSPPGWLRRRAWILVLAAVVGAFGGHAYGSRSKPSYAATAVLAVPAGATAVTPGSANEAGALAITYAAVLQNDHSVLRMATARLGLPVSTLAKHYSVSVETNTSLILLRYTAATPAEAVQGANVVAFSMTGGTKSSVIPNNTLTIVQSADSASETSDYAKHGLLLGFVLGLAIGAIFVLILERVDTRADKSRDISDTFGEPTSAVPSEVSVAELSHIVANQTEPNSDIDLAPLRRADVRRAWTLRRMWRTTDSNGADPADGSSRAPDARSVSVSRAIQDGTEDLFDADAVVLVVRSGERMKVIGTALQRLRLLGVPVTWTVLLDRRVPSS